jgi:hypothetical protein
VYMQISRGLPSSWPDEDDKLFTPIWPLQAHLQEDQPENGNQQE